METAVRHNFGLTEVPPSIVTTMAAGAASSPTTVRRTRSGEVASPLAGSPHRRHVKSTNKRDGSSASEPSDEESASSAQLLSAGDARPSRASKKEHKDAREKKKKGKSLRQTSDGLMHRKPKKHTISDSDDETAHRRATKPKKEARSPNNKSPKKGRKSPLSGASEDESDTEDRSERKARKHLRRSRDGKKPKHTTSMPGTLGAKHSVTVTSSSKHSKSRTASREDVTVRRRTITRADGDSSSSSDSEPTTPTKRSKKSRSRRSTERSEPATSDSESSSSEGEGARGHRRRAGLRSKDRGGRSRSASRGSSQERKTDNTIRRQGRISRFESSGSSDGSPDTGLTSPKGEEIGRMHKEIETLKNLTKILEEKLETLEHIPDNAESAMPSARTNKGSKLSDSSDGAESSRKKVKPRHAASTPVVSSGKRESFSAARQGETSRSTADFTKHGRTQMDKAKRHRRAQRKPRSHGDSESDGNNSNSSDGGTDDEAVAEEDESRKLRRSISLTALRTMPSQEQHRDETEVVNIKKERDHDNKVMNQRAVRERARGQREHDRQRAPSVPYVSPFGNSPTTKSLEYCYSCLMKTDISTNGNRKLWKRRVLGFGTNGMNLIKPYTEKVEHVWPWPTIQQWIINDEQNLIKFMTEEEVRHHHRSSSSDSDHSSSESEREDEDAHAGNGGGGKSKIAIYTFRVDDVNKVNDSLWKVVKRVQKKRTGLGSARGTGTRSQSTQSSARNSDNEGDSDSSDDDQHTNHHPFKESMHSFFKALTHSLGGHGKDQHHKDHKDHSHGKDPHHHHKESHHKEHRDKDHNKDKERK